MITAVSEELEDYQRRFQSIITACANKYEDDPQKAADTAYKQLIRQDWFEEFRETLVRHSIREHIWDVRHRNTLALKNRAGAFGGPAKVGTGTGAANAVAAMSFLDRYAIDGRSLGSVLGAELPLIRDKCLARGRGEVTNAAVCSALIQLVPADKTVRDCVSNEKAESIHRTAKCASAHIGICSPKH